MFPGFGDTSRETPALRAPSLCRHTGLQVFDQVTVSWLLAVVLYRIKHSAK